MFFKNVYILYIYVNLNLNNKSIFINKFLKYYFSAKMLILLGYENILVFGVKEFPL